MCPLPEHPTADAIAAQLGAVYGRFSATDRQRHAELVERIDQPGSMAIEAVAGAEGLWTVTVCAADRVGALSLIAGTFTAQRVDIVEGQVFTVRRQPASPPARQPAGAGGGPRRVRQRPGRRRAREAGAAPSRVILDVFSVRPPAGAGPELWEALSDGLEEVASLLAADEGERARDLVIDRVAASITEAAAGGEQLLPVSVELDAEGGQDATVLRICSTDTRGFLFEFTNALAMLGLNIVHAELHTIEGEVLDTFHVTDAGG